MVNQGLTTDQLINKMEALRQMTDRDKPDFIPKAQRNIILDVLNKIDYYQEFLNLDHDTVNLDKIRYER